MTVEGRPSVASRHRGDTRLHAGRPETAPRTGRKQWGWFPATERGRGRPRHGEGDGASAAGMRPVRLGERLC